MSSKFIQPSNNNLCIRNCCLDEQKICMGCGRSLAEILEWHHAEDTRKAIISTQAQQRLKQRDNN